MTKEEFRDGLQDAIADMSDPDGEWADFLAEGRDLANELGDHDPVLKTKITAIITSIEDFGAYIRTRAE